MPAMRNEATRRLKHPQVTHANGGELLRIAAVVNATSSEHTLNPHNPIVKREPWLRNRE